MVTCENSSTAHKGQKQTCFKDNALIHQRGGETNFGWILSSQSSFPVSQNDKLHLSPLPLEQIIFQFLDLVYEDAW